VPDGERRDHAGGAALRSEIGQQVRLRAAWVISPHVTLAGTFEHVFAGDALKRANRGDSTFTATQILVRF
jgi:uncharacterized protein YhjY with autotransporter beta-barrel domain